MPSGRQIVGCLVLLTILFAPGLILSAVIQSILPVFLGPIVMAFLMLLVPALPTKGRAVTPEQYADELERHLLGTEGPYDWDETTSIRIADERLKRLQGKLSRFDSLTRKEDQDELRRIIDALRRGEVPDIPDS